MLKSKLNISNIINHSIAQPYITNMKNINHQHEKHHVRLLYIMMYKKIPRLNKI